jgi:hypothetical protein
LSHTPGVNPLSSRCNPNELWRHRHGTIGLWRGEAEFAAVRHIMVWTGRAPTESLVMLQSAADSRKESAMNDIATHEDRIATVGIDLGKRSFHLIGMDVDGKIVMRQNCRVGDWSGAWPISNRVSSASKPVLSHTTLGGDCRSSAITFG